MSEHAVVWACLSLLWEGCVSVCCGKGVSECAVGRVCLSVLWEECV